MLKKIVLVSLLAAALSGIVAAQEQPAATEEAVAPAATEEVPSAYPLVLAGLNSPRNLTTGFQNGAVVVYIAESGTGGDQDAEGLLGTVKAGLTGQVTALNADGSSQVVLDNLLSIDPGFGEMRGPAAVLSDGNSLWVALGEGTKAPFAAGVYSGAVIKVDLQSGTVQTLIDLQAFENIMNPDGTPELVSNPSDLALDLVEAGLIYIVDSSANAVLKWSADTGLNIFASWPSADDGSPQAVPTSVAIDQGGDVYVGFLGGFPFTAGSSKIERYSRDGQLVATIEGLTYVTDLQTSPIGELYVVQMADGYGDFGFNPNSGSVLKIAPDGTQTVLASGLNYPYAMTGTPNGWLVSVGTAFGASGALVNIGSD